MAQLALSDFVIAELRVRKTQEEYYDADFPGPGSFGLRVGRSGRKTFFLVYSVKGIRRRISLGTYPVVGVEQARERALAALRELEAGRDPKPLSRRRPALQPTFGDVAEEFFRERSAGDASPSTLREYRRILDRELLPVWDKTDIDKLSPADVTALLEEISADRNRPAMANRVRALASAIFNHGKKRGYVTENPVSATDVVSELRRRAHILGANEIVSYWRASEREPLVYEVLLKLLLITGQRVQDLLSMTWADVLFDRLLLGPRTMPRRQVAIAPLGLDLIRRLQTEGSARGTTVSNSEEAIFTARRGKRLSLRRPFARVSERLGSPLSARDIRLTVRAQLYRLHVRPDVVEHALNNQTIPQRFLRQHGGLNYDLESRRAMLLWSKTLSRLIQGQRPTTPPTKPRSSDGKVVPLFR